MRTKSLVVLASTFVIAAGTASAFENTGNDIANAFIAAHESALSSVVAVGDVVETDSGVTISGLTVEYELGDMDIAEGPDPFENVTSATSEYTAIVIAGGSLDGDVLRADEISAEAMVSVVGPVNIAGGRLEMLNAVLEPGVLGGTGTLNSLNTAAETNWYDITVEFEGQQYATAEAMLAKSEGDVESTLTTSGSIEGIQLNTSVLPPEVTGMLAALNLLDARSTLSMAVSLASGEGAIMMDQMRLTVDDAVSVDMGFQLSGIDVPQMMNAMTAGEDDQALLASVEGISLVGFAVSVTDNGLRERGLALASAMMGTSPDGLQALATLGLAGALASAGVPELANQATTAVSQFLSDGGTLTVAAEPAEPLGEADFSAIDPRADPAALVKLLNLQISAR